MKNNEKLLAEARRLAVIDRISSEPVVAMLGRIADALEAVEKGPICPQPCTHLSQEDAREGLSCVEHPCTCRKPQGEPSDDDLIKLANDAHHRMVDEAEADGGWYGFSHSRDAWQNGFETGYRARAAGGAQ